MSEPMRKPRTDRSETVTVGNREFQVPWEKARAVLVLLKDSGVISRPSEEETIPADVVFREEIAKYTKPGLALRGARLKEEISQVDLAKKLGISQSDLSKMEYGKRPIGKKMAKRLSKILNIDYRVFL